MMSIRVVFFAAATFALLFAFLAVAVRVLLPSWWRRRAVRLGLLVGAVSTVLSLAVWGVGSARHLVSVQRIGVHLAWGILAFVLPLALAVGVAGVGSRALSFLFARPKKGTPDDAAAAAKAVSRREIIQFGAAVVPLGAVGASTAGLVEATFTPICPRVDMRYAALPAPLSGLRILQLTDLHLGYYRSVSDVAKVIEHLADAPPDLVVITGDVADDLSQLGPVLRLADSLHPRLGVFAAPGNHEYFHRIADVRRIYDKSPVPLLIEQGAKIDAGGASLYVACAGDPVSLHGDPTGFLERSIDRALDGAPSDAFHLLLCHRPAGFDPAAARGVELTLSGHTHGGQVGAFGRSAFELVARGHYLRGAYAKGASRLYTSAGFGHWFPFRLGCAAEAPTIVLG